MKEITSRTNELIKHVTRIATQKKYREQTKQFCAEGIRICKTLREDNIKLLHLFTTPSMKNQAQTFIESDELILVPDHVMEKISQSSSPSGILGIFEKPKTPSTASITPGIVLAQIADPGNMGTLIRTAAAMNVSSVIVINGADPWSPKVVQASAGTLGGITLFEWTWSELVLNKQSIPLVGLVAHGGEPPEKAALNASLLVVGSEAHGIAQNWLEDCDQRITLAMPGNTESLNAAVAGSIALYLGYHQN